MDHNEHHTRHIAVNLEHGSDGSATLHTTVQREALHHDTVKRGPDAHGLPLSSSEVEDVGWDGEKLRPEDYAIDGIKNEDIWLLVRRFNKRVFHLKHVPNHPDDELDFNVAEEEQFSPNKLRAQLERLYMGAIIGFIMFRQHLSRLQSWREPRRTACFCLVYFIAWYFSLLMPTLLTALMGILLSHRIRHTLFPPCPPSLVHYQGGHLIKPAAGVLGTVDTATGAPENLKGQTLETEASNFATGIVALSINVFVDKDPQHDESQRGGGKTVDLPDPRSLATQIVTAKDKAAGVDKPSWDKSKSPMQELMWSQMRPLMHWICRFCDVWERSAKIVTLGIGVGFFGSIAMTRSYGWLKHVTERFIFKGIPTDSQLTITLLRKSEQSKSPLPPPPTPKGPPPDSPHVLDVDVITSSAGDRPLGASKEEIAMAATEDSRITRTTGGDDHEQWKPDTGGNRRGKLLKIVKPVASVAAKTIIAVDKVRAKTGTVSAKNRVGAAATREKPSIAGPVEFTCRWQGEKGFVYLTTDTNSPCLCFSKRSVGDFDGSNYHEVQPSWTIPVREITTLNKYSGYGAKAKLLAGWALEDEITDGLKIVDKEGNTTLVTAMARRDQLFNRLCAIGGQKWEIW
ncbi:hypothetical protein FBEOM_11449 [Fusarium beomiforme]|uniref:Uncharacterized protein n=1 Tax=Fusarium beomiforme TaxID=44412 RepID=A0A9P5DTZ6_9HYPO|nr:hypothetical protein FBEOM_11449 [Fusarium beomiforme]